VLDPFGEKVVQTNPFGPYVGEVGKELGEELGLAKDDPVVWSAPLGLPPRLGAVDSSEDPDDKLGALVTKEDSDDGLGPLVELAPNPDDGLGAFDANENPDDGLGALVELAPNPDDGLGAFDANEDPDDGLGALVKMAPTVGLLVLLRTHLSA